MNLLHSNEIPPIGFGPGIVGYTPKWMKSKKRVTSFFARFYKKFYLTPHQQKEYKNAIINALKIGYRIIDFSRAYGDGKLIGEAIRESGIPREQIFFTTRVDTRSMMDHNVRERFLEHLSCLGLDYVDLLQIHWPVTGLVEETWKEMERLYEDGFVKHLGVANCHAHHVNHILSFCKYKPEIGQFEIHPLFTQKPLIDFYHENDMVVEAYTPIARYDERLVRLPILKKLEEKYNKNFVQIILKWHIQNGVIPCFRSLNVKHLADNFNIFDFTLSEEDMKTIDGININSRLRYDPDNCDFNIL